MCRCAVSSNQVSPPCLFLASLSSRQQVGPSQVREGGSKGHFSSGAFGPPPWRRGRRRPWRGWGWQTPLLQIRVPWDQPLTRMSPFWGHYTNPAGGRMHEV